jgi:hypothetical protein
MIREFESVSQFPDDHSRRWFADEFFDLIVWFGNDGVIFGFQLVYDKDHNQRAVTWMQGKGFSHNRIDDGENRPGRYKATPILVLDGAFDFKQIAERFRRESAEISREIADLVYNKLLTYPNQ